jgi:hypothetical protein
MKKSILSSIVALVGVAFITSCTTKTETASTTTTASSSEQTNQEEHLGCFDSGQLNEEGLFLDQEVVHEEERRQRLRCNGIAVAISFALSFRVVAA